MTRISLLTTAVAVSLLSSGALLASANAASNTRMQACGAQWQSMKTAGTSGAMKWTDFLKTCTAGAAQPAFAAASTTAAANPVVKVRKPKTSTTAAPAAAAAPAKAGQTFMQACSAQWSGMKTAGTVPAGMKWKDFLKTCGAGAASTAANAPAVQPASAAPAASPAGAKPAGALPAVAAAKGASVPATGGQLAEQTRIKACGVQWQSAKAANSIPAGQTWPQFWSACDTRLKAANG
jgi:hypothetical protein